MDQLEGVRRLDSDKVDLYQQTPKRPARVARKSPFQESSPVQALSGQYLGQVIEESHFHTGLPKKLQRRIRNGSFAIESTLDLHGYRQHQALDALQNFLMLALKNGERFVLVIHGKGFRSGDEAKLRPLVRHALAQHADVLAYCPAQVMDGGNGASYVYLRNANHLQDWDQDIR